MGLLRRARPARADRANEPAGCARPPGLRSDRDGRFGGSAKTRSRWCQRARACDQHRCCLLSVDCCRLSERLDRRTRPRAGTTVSGREPAPRSWADAGRTSFVAIRRSVSFGAWILGPARRHAAPHLPLRRRRGQHAPDGAPWRGRRRRAVALPRPGGVDGSSTTAAACSSASATGPTPASPSAVRRWPPPTGCRPRSATTTGASIGRMRIRIALVTGDVEVRGDRYYGRPLFRAARLQALASGGETLLVRHDRRRAGRRAARRHRPARPRHAAAARRARSPNGCSRWCILPARDQRRCARRTRWTESRGSRA